METDISKRLRELEMALSTLTNAVRVQAGCLEHYAELNGFEGGKNPSVFHFQAAHFRDYADSAEQVLNRK